MAERDAAAVDVERFVRDFAERAGAAKMLAAKLRGARGGLAGEHLSGKGLVDLDEVGVFQAKPATLLHARNRVDGTEAHACGLAAGISVVDEATERLEPAAAQAGLAHHEQRHGAVGDL